MNRKISVTEVILCLLSVFFLIGSISIFNSCGPKEDGSFMLCHYANNVETGIAAVLSAISLIRIFLPDIKVKAGMAVSMIPVCVLGILIPGHLVPLCMMKEMRCHAVMAPAVTVCLVLVIAVSVIDLFVISRRVRK
ncbi:MAG: DUF4418 family protein [Oscillospiraceae bacterium]|nr:DUF4418 family protein [Oscillospiraceae bacterium]